VHFSALPDPAGNRDEGAACPCGMRCALVVLGVTATAHAGVAPGPPASRDTLPVANWADVKEVLPVSMFPDERMGGHPVDLFCPHADGAGALLIVVPDRGQPRGELTEVARIYASLGYVTVVVDASAVAAVAAAPPPVRADEPGCQTTGAVGVIGFGAGGRAAMTVRGVATAISMYAGYTAPPAHDTPILIVEVEAYNIPSTPRAWIYSEPGTLACDFRAIEAGCWADRRAEWSPEREKTELERAARRRAFVLGNTIPWLHVWLDHDARANHFMESHRLTAGPPIGLLAEQEDLLPASTELLFSLAFVGGYSSDGGTLVGGRTELVWRHHRERILPGVGLGAYLQLAHLADAGGEAEVGVTAVGYSGKTLSLAPSLGVFSDAQGDGVRAGLFFGMRGYSRSSVWDMPVGVRIDGGYGFGGSRERSVSVSLVTDVRAVLTSTAGLLVAALVPRN
jgi:hypothetical protein